MTPSIPASLCAATSSLRIAVICADWHNHKVAQVRAAAIGEIQGAGPADVAIEAFELPEAGDIPLLAKKLARSGHYQALIACGRTGEASSASVVDGLVRVQLETTVPVFSAVLGPRECPLHDEHPPLRSHDYQRKGRELAQACLQALADSAALRQPHHSGPLSQLAA